MKNKKGNIVLLVVIAVILGITVCVMSWMIIEKGQVPKAQELNKLKNLAQQQELQNKVEQENKQVAIGEKQKDVINNQEVKSPSMTEQESKDLIMQQAIAEENKAMLISGTKNLKEGEEYNLDFDEENINECASGLTPVVGAKEFNGSCAFPACSCYVCTKCGDGVCGKGENWCNCAKDCKKGEGEAASVKDLYDPQVYSNEE